MIGYLAGQTGFDQSYSDLVGTLPDTLKSFGITSQYRAFGLRMTDPIADGAGKLTEKQFYLCDKADRSTCDNNESRLDLAFGRIAANPDEMGLIISDLWFTNSEVSTSGIAPLQAQITEILAQGRMISIYGIMAPFDGTIYDLPTGDQSKLKAPYSGKHPLFLVVVGTKEQGLEFEKALTRSPSQRIAAAANTGLFKRTHFTVDPGPLEPRSKAPLDPGTHQRITRSSIAQFDGVTVQQFLLKAGLPPKKGVDEGKRPVWTAPKDEHFIANAAWEGPLAPKLRFWAQRDEQCTAQSWSAPVTINGKWQPVPGEAGKMSVELDPSTLSGRLAREGVYLVSGELERTSVAQNGPKTEWLRAWNLRPEQAASVAASRPTEFPTLNLSEFGRLMENALASAAERQGGGIVGFSILVKVEK